MKVKQAQKFIPIVITIESEEEAKMLWAMLNVSIDTVKKEHPYNRSIVSNVNNAFGITSDMWHKFNEVYRPQEANK